MTLTDDRTTDAQAASEAKAQAFLHQIVGDWGATLGSALVVIGDKLGLYDALKAAGPLTSAELARCTGTNERYCREWLLAQAAGGYLEYDPAAGRYSLPPEHAAVLGAVIGGFQMMNALTRAEPRIVEAFKSGGGMAWGEHDADVFEGCERFFRPGYEAHLVSAWIPALTGIEAKLRAGGQVADVGCGHGASTLIMADAFPNTRLAGFDSHAGSIEKAKQAAGAKLGARVRFEVADATSYGGPAEGYDLIALFDCLHDMVDPIGALRHAAERLAHGGSILMVEPMAGETIADNLNPVGRVYASASVLVCTPSSMSGGGLALGTVASEASLREVAFQAGLGSFRRVAETPFNRIFELRH
jgi:SAM-dependent methyltransferase